MKIYTFRLTKGHMIAAVLAAAALVAALILLLPGSESRQTGGTAVIREPADCAEYLRQLGFETELSSAESRTVLIPKEFDAVYEAYNALQKECGFDLTRYAGKRVELTTLKITNWPEEEAVLADVLVYKKRVIGGAVYTASVDGFMQGLSPRKEPQA